MTEFVTFEPKTEPWSEYELEDGTIIRVRTTVTLVHRTDEYDERGNPMYQVRTHAALDIECPEQLRRNVHEGSEAMQ